MDDEDQHLFHAREIARSLGYEIDDSDNNTIEIVESQNYDAGTHGDSNPSNLVQTKNKAQGAKKKSTLKSKISAMKQRKQKIEKWFRIAKIVFTIYMSIIGMVSFSLFILEESLQTAMFSTWAAKNAGDWDLIIDANIFFKKTVNVMVRMNNLVGWLNPFSYVAYNAYGEATDEIILANESQLACFAPELLSERRIPITIHMKIKELTFNGDGSIMVYSFKFRVLLSKEMMSDKATFLPRLAFNKDGSLDAGSTIVVSGTVRALHDGAAKPGEQFLIIPTSVSSPKRYLQNQ